MRAATLAVLQVLLFTLLSLGWVAVLVAVAIALIVAREVPFDPTRPGALDPADAGVLIGVAAVAQIAGFVAVALGLALCDDRDRAVLDRLKAVVPLRRPGRFELVALAGGLCVWTLPSWLAQGLNGWFDGWTSTPELLTDALMHGTPAGKVAMAFAIAVSAPVFEEIVFRGYLWRVVARGFGEIGALLGTTLLFAAYHLDPIQSVALLPTALFIGWLRYRSGVLGPSIVAHFANNGLGVVLALAAPGAEEAAMGLPLALGGFALTAVVVLVGEALTRAARPA